jgi:hypothetical protein
MKVRKLLRPPTQIRPKPRLSPDSVDWSLFSLLQIGLAKR